MKSRLTTVLVMSSERRSCLMDRLKGIETNLRAVSTCEDAARLLRDDPDISLVLTDLSLPDGSWFDVLSVVSDLHPGANVVVCAPVDDELLWTSVLEAGGFDVLVEPYEEHEIQRILTAAIKTCSQYRLAKAS